MSKYRDDLGAAHRRIEILTAQIAERDAALAVRELELQELQAHLDLLEERPSMFRKPSLATRLHRLRVPLLVGGAISVVGMSLSMSEAPPIPAGDMALGNALLTDPMPAPIAPALWEVEPLPGDPDPSLWKVQAQAATDYLPGRGLGPRAEAITFEGEAPVHGPLTIRPGPGNPPVSGHAAVGKAAVAKTGPTE
jgi:hypothetical protein